MDTKCNVDDFTCDCSNSKLCDPDHGHIVTGNLDVITNRKLRSLLAKGPSYREAEIIDWDKVYHNILNGINICVTKWCASEKLVLRFYLNGKIVYYMQFKFELILSNLVVDVLKEKY